jgi:hypothetical protein
MTLNQTRRRLVALAVAVLALAGACASTTADTVGLRYDDGPIEGEHFEGIVQPGSGQQLVGPFNRIIRLPINQREYTFCAQVRTKDNDNGCDAPPIVVTALGGAELAFSGGVTFELNTGDPDVLTAFYQEICRKFDCANEDGVRNKGWDEMLRVNMRGPIEDSLQEVVRGYSVDAIYAGVPAEGEAVTGEEALSTLTKITESMKASIKETINAYAGGDFFCGPGYDREKPDECPDFEFIITEVTPSDEVKSAFDRNVASRQAVIDAQNRAEQERVEAEGKRAAQDALAGLYADPAYRDYLRALAEQECASNPECTIVITGGNAVNVNAG